MLQSLRTTAGGSGPAPTLPAARRTVAATVPAPRRPAPACPVPPSSPRRTCGGRHAGAPGLAGAAASSRIVLVLALAATLFVLLEEWQPADGAGGVRVEAPPADPGADTTGSAPTDTEGSAITALATSLADGGLPGDGALAERPAATAAQAPGAGRQASAQQALSLAQASCSTAAASRSGQYQDVVNVLQPTGATVPRRPRRPPSPRHRSPSSAVLPGARPRPRPGVRGATRGSPWPCAHTAKASPDGGAPRPAGLRCVAEAEEGPMQTYPGRRSSRR